MASLGSCLCVAAATLAAQQFGGVFLSMAPPAWGYELTKACTYQPRPWTRILLYTPRPTMSVRTRRAIWDCEWSHGLRSPIPLVKTILPRWPSEAELAAIDPRQGITDEDFVPLPPRIRD